MKELFVPLAISTVLTWALPIGKASSGTAVGPLLASAATSSPVECVIIDAYVVNATIQELGERIELTTEPRISSAGCCRDGEVHGGSERPIDVKAGGCSTTVYNQSEMMKTFHRRGTARLLAQLSVTRMKPLGLWPM